VGIQNFSATFFSVLAYAMPVLLAVHHLERAGWKLAPSSCAGLVASAGAFAMTARMSTFLADQVPEPNSGTWSKSAFEALLLWGLSTLALAVFVWVVPALRRNIVDIPVAFRSWWRGKSAQGAGFDLATEKARDTLLGALWRASVNAACVAGSLTFIVGYVAWPAWPLVIEQSRDQQSRLAARATEAKAEAEARKLRADALAAAARLDDLVSTLVGRRNYCESEKCNAAYAARIQRINSTIQGFGVMPVAGVFDVNHVAEKLSDRELVDRFNATLDQLAARHRVSLQRAPVLARVQFDADAAEAVAKKASAKADANLMERLRETFSDPAKILLPLAKDPGMALALALEMVAILLMLVVRSEQERG
jgi:hypothetical protein